MPNKNKRVNKATEVKNIDDMFRVVKRIKNKLDFLKSVLGAATYKEDKKSKDFCRKYSEDICYLKEFFTSRINTYTRNTDQENLQMLYSCFERLGNGTLENIYKGLSSADQKKFGNPKKLLNGMKQICLYQKSEIDADYRNSPDWQPGFSFDEVSRKADAKVRIQQSPFDENGMVPRKLTKILDKDHSNIMSAPLTVTKLIFNNIKTSGDSKEYQELKEKLTAVTDKIQTLNKENGFFAGTKRELNSEIFPDLCELNILAHNYMNHAKSSSLSAFSNKTSREQKMVAAENLIHVLNDLTLQLPGFDISSKAVRKDVKDAYKTDEYTKITKKGKVSLYPIPTDPAMNYLKYAAARTSTPVLRNQMNIEFIDPDAAEWSIEQREKYCCDLVVNSILDAAMKDEDYGHPLINCMLKEDGNIDTAREMVRSMQAYQNLVRNLTSPKKYMKIAGSPSKCSELAAALKPAFAGKESAKVTLAGGKIVITGNAPKPEVKLNDMPVPA